MPIREHACLNPTCHEFNQVVEHFFKTSDGPPICHCGEVMKQQVSRFGVVFTGAITARYNDKKLENSHQEGHWMCEKKTPDGKPKFTWVDSWETRKRIMKQEGLVEASAGDAGADGKSLSTRGMSGQWV